MALVEQDYDIDLYITFFVKKINNVKLTRTPVGFIMLMDNITKNFTDDKEVVEQTVNITLMFITHFKEPLEQQMSVPLFEELNPLIADYTIKFIVKLCKNPKVRAFLDKVYKL